MVKCMCYKILLIRIPVCETWSLILREEGRLRVLENRVLRRIFGPKREKVTGEWRKLHNEELNDLHPSPNITLVIKSRKIRWAGYVERMDEKRGVHKVFGEEYRSLSSSLCSFLHSPVTLFLLVLNTLLSTPFSNTFSSVP